MNKTGEDSKQKKKKKKRQPKTTNLRHIFQSLVLVLHPRMLLRLMAFHHRRIIIRIAAIDTFVRLHVSPKMIAHRSVTITGVDALWALVLLHRTGRSFAFEVRRHLKSLFGSFHCCHRRWQRKMRVHGRVVSPKLRPTLEMVFTVNAFVNRLCWFFQWRYWFTNCIDCAKSDGSLFQCSWKNIDTDY